MKGWKGTIYEQNAIRIKGSGTRDKEMRDKEDRDKGPGTQAPELDTSNGSMDTGI